MVFPMSALGKRAKDVLYEVGCAVGLYPVSTYDTEVNICFQNISTVYYTFKDLNVVAEGYYTARTTQTAAILMLEAFIANGFTNEKEERVYHTKVEITPGNTNLDDLRELCRNMMLPEPKFSLVSKYGRSRAFVYEVKGQVGAYTTYASSWTKRKAKQIAAATLSAYLIGKADHIKHLYEIIVSAYVEIYKEKILKKKRPVKKLREKTEPTEEELKIHRREIRRRHRQARRARIRINKLNEQLKHEDKFLRSFETMLISA